MVVVVIAGEGEACAVSPPPSPPPSTPRSDEALGRHIPTPNHGTLSLTGEERPPPTHPLPPAPCRVRRRRGAGAGAAAPTRGGHRCAGPAGGAAAAEPLILAEGHRHRIRTLPRAVLPQHTGAATAVVVGKGRAACVPLSSPLGTLGLDGLPKSPLLSSKEVWLGPSPVTPAARGGRGWRCCPRGPRSLRPAEAKVPVRGGGGDHVPQGVPLRAVNRRRPGAFTNGDCGCSADGCSNASGWPPPLTAIPRPGLVNPDTRTSLSNVSRAVFP